MHKSGNISRKFLTFILKIYDKNFERLHSFIKVFAEDKEEADNDREKRKGAFCNGDHQ